MLLKKQDKHTTASHKYKYMLYFIPILKVNKDKVNKKNSPYGEFLIF